jgi:hypothetical protein
MPTLKAKLRGLRRTLAHAIATGKGDVSQLERDIESLTREVEVAGDAAKQSHRERQHALRYRKVKFFEKRKATRKITAAVKKLNDPDLDAALRGTLEQERTQARADLEYIKNFPTGEKYIALYANADDDPKTVRRREEIRARILEGQGGAREAASDAENST